MAPKSFYLWLCIFLFLTYVSLKTHAKSHNPKVPKPSPFEFINHLQGCHKGENVSGLHDLKTYLERFGYLNYNHTNNQAHAHDDIFDDLLESSIKTYQLNYHITPTGVLDSPTVTRMTAPRCGVPDIVNGMNYMRGGRNRHSQRHRHDSLHTVSHYSFFPNSPKWPQTHLTYALPPNTDSRVVTAVGNAFSTWASATHFTFSQSQSYTAADIKVSFARGDHGDGSPFDGPGGTIAHAFAPTDGRFHYDADERYSVGAVPGALDLETVAVHEIGHLLGLGHSDIEDAIMFPSISAGTTKGLHEDDIQGIRALYNV